MDRNNIIGQKIAMIGPFSSSIDRGRFYNIRLSEGTLQAWAAQRLCCTDGGISFVGQNKQGIGEKTILHGRVWKLGNPNTLCWLLVQSSMIAAVLAIWNMTFSPAMGKRACVARWGGGWGEGVELFPQSLIREGAELVRVNEGRIEVALFYSFCVWGEDMEQYSGLSKYTKI